MPDGVIHSLCEGDKILIPLQHLLPSLCPGTPLGTEHAPFPCCPAQTLVMHTLGMRWMEHTCASKIQVCECQPGVLLPRSHLCLGRLASLGPVHQACWEVVYSRRGGRGCQADREAVAVGSQESHLVVSRGTFQVQGPGRAPKASFGASPSQTQPIPRHRMARH